ncbi:unnamed protein product [Effrenium voratum]|uniref:Uncharacterized protein n=1 Tax=Effrenium voratum TaxID=2562239 RepID=A0AA36HTU6_9DINO|nr:unnamed protein product [Effrenium voratum]
MDDDVPPPPPPPPPETKELQEEPHWRDRPMEASKRAAPGDTIKELSALLQALGAESPRGDAERAQEPQAEVEATEEVEEERGRGGRSSASRRAAPGDTLREELLVMRLGADSEKAALEHTGRGRR